MPFTPFHFGPALGFGLPLRKYIHLPTFIIANVIVDIEPFIVLVLGLNYPLHGYLHTYISAIFLGIVGGYMMFLLERYFQPLYKTLFLESDKNYKLLSFILAGISGIMLHVTLDSPLYSDIRPLYPLEVNPLYNPTLAFEIYTYCIWIGLIGIIFYIGLVGSSLYRRFFRK
jgi:hypothetical protein